MLDKNWLMMQSNIQRGLNTYLFEPNLNVDLYHQTIFILLSIAWSVGSLLDPNLKKKKKDYTTLWNMWFYIIWFNEPLSDQSITHY